MAGTRYQLLEVLEFCNRERAQPPSITITVLTFLVKKKYNEEFQRVCFLTLHRKAVNQSRTRSRSRRRSRPRI